MQVVDMPLLFETGAYRLTWPRVLVACNAETQLERLMARDNSGTDASKARVASQMPLEAKRKLASTVIDNSGSLEATRDQARLLSRKPRRIDWPQLLRSCRPTHHELSTYMRCRRAEIYRHSQY